MARTIGTDFSNQLSSSQTRPFYAVEFIYTQPLRIWTGYGDFQVLNQTYLGLGNLISISDIKETAETKASGISIEVGGLNQDIVAQALLSTAQNIIVNVYFGVLETSGNALTVVDTPYEVFSGNVDTVIINESADNSTITFNIENKLISLEKPLDFRYTDQDQKHFFPDDKGLEFVDDLQDKNIIWGGG